MSTCTWADKQSASARADTLQHSIVHSNNRSFVRRCLAELQQMVIVEQQWRDQTANISQQFRENRWGQYKCPECNEYTMRVDLVDIFGTNMVTGEDIGHNEYTCLGCGYMDG